MFATAAETFYTLAGLNEPEANLLDAKFHFPSALTIPAFCLLHQSTDRFPPYPHPHGLERIDIHS